MYVFSAKHTLTFDLAAQLLTYTVVNIVYEGLAQHTPTNDLGKICPTPDFLWQDHSLDAQDDSQIQVCGKSV